MRPSLLQRGPMRRRLRILRRRREAMLLDLGALVLEMHRHGRFLPDGVARRAAEAVGTDAEVRALSRALEAGDGDPDLVAAGVAGNCPSCGALHTLGASFCSQCGTRLEESTLPRKAQLGQDPDLMPQAAALPRRPIPAAVPPPPPKSETARPEPEPEPEREPEPEAARGARQARGEQHKEEPAERTKSAAPAAAPARVSGSRARATRVRQRLNEPARSSQALPTGLIAGIAGGILVIGLGILLLSGGDGNGGSEEPDRASQAPAENQPEPPPDDAPVTPTPGETVPGSDPPESTVDTALEPVEAVTAEAYDPAGDDEEHSEEAALAVDGDDSTTWPTEEYETGALQKEGVGLVLRPDSPVAARGLDIRTTTPGFDVTIYGAEGSVPDSVDSGWAEIASEQAVSRQARIALDAAGNEFSHYLIWITALPDDEGKVEIAETRLLT